jgi:hypothetical protein
LRLDSYTIRRYIDDLCYRIRDRSSSPADSKKYLQIGVLAGICVLCIGWIAYRSVPERSTAQLTQEQSFLVSAGLAMVEDAGEDAERFAFVTLLEQESGGYRIVGSVRSQQDLEHLRQRLVTLNPQAAIEWDIAVAEPRR